jgi:hypothetical protein
MWPQYKFVFATKSSRISEPYKFVQKLESEIEIFPSPTSGPSAVAPPSAGVVAGHEEEAEVGVALAKDPGTESRRPREAPDRGTEAAGRSPWSSTLICMELRCARHGDSAAARAMEQEAEAELLALTRLPPCILSSLTAPPPLRPKAPSSAARSLQMWHRSTRCWPPPGPCSSFSAAQHPFQHGRPLLPFQHGRRQAPAPRLCRP